MSLQKGFLRAPEFRLTGWHIFSALVISSLVALLFHGLFVFVREALRLGVRDATKIVLPLNSQDLFIYDTAMAAMAAAIGQGFAIIMLFQNIGHKTPFKTRHSQRTVRDGVVFNLWMWLFWVGKLLSIMGIIYAAFHIHYHINLQRDFWVLIWGIPLVWFFNNWLHSYRLFRKHYFKWLGLGFFQWLLLIFFLGKFQWVNYESIKQTIDQTRIETRYDMEFGQAQSLLRIDVEPEAIFYLVWLNEEPRIILDNRMWRDKSVGFDKLTEFLEHAFDPRWPRHKAELTIDSRIPMEYVLRFERALRQNKVDQIHYRLSIQNSRYPWQYAKYKEWGMPKILPQPCEDTRSHLDSLINLGINAKGLIWPDFPCYDVALAMKKNRLHVGRNKQGYTLNYHDISYQELMDKLTQLRKKHEEHLVVFYQPALDLNFGEYIEGRDLIYQSAIKNRVQLARDAYDFEYHYCEGYWCDFRYKDYYALLSNKYPTHYLELTGWNLELYNYLKKQP